MYLVDANIFLELLLEQEKAQKVKSFFQETTTEQIFISDISFYSIGITLFRYKQETLFDKFLSDIYINNINILTLPFVKTYEIKNVSEKFKLDFEDSCQYLLAKEFNLTLVSFDKDFNKTDIKRFELK